jgi:hypothetical protein
MMQSVHGRHAKKLIDIEHEIIITMAIMMHDDNKTCSYTSLCY